MRVARAPIIPVRVRDRAEAKAVIGKQRRRGERTETQRVFIAKRTKMPVR
jgi:hypothetical protein